MTDREIIEGFIIKLGGPITISKKENMISTEVDGYKIRGYFGFWVDFKFNDKNELIEMGIWE